MELERAIAGASDPLARLAHAIARSVSGGGTAELVGWELAELTGLRSPPPTSRPRTRRSPSQRCQAPAPPSRSIRLPESWRGHSKSSPSGAGRHA